MASTVVRMAHDKKDDRHKTPRTTVQIPTSWLILARKLAKAAEKPTTWYFMKLLADAADAEGVDRPALPWEDEEK